MSKKDAKEKDLWKEVRDEKSKTERTNSVTSTDRIYI